jgi:phage terminase small subunit
MSKTPPKSRKPGHHRRKPRDLNDREKAFCRVYVRNQNATAAALEAGYSKATAHVQGSRLLQRPEIQEEIKRLEAKSNETVERLLKDAGKDVPEDLIRDAQAEAAAILDRSWVVMRQIKAVQIALGELPSTVSRVVTIKGHKGEPPKREVVTLQLYTLDLPAANRGLELLHKEVDRQSGNKPPSDAEEFAGEFAKAMQAFNQVRKRHEEGK